jgi:hypothetical protein
MSEWLEDELQASPSRNLCSLNIKNPPKKMNGLSFYEGFSICQRVKNYGVIKSPEVKTYGISMMDAGTPLV